MVAKPSFSTSLSTVFENQLMGFIGQQPLLCEVSMERRWLKFVIIYCVVLLMVGASILAFDGYQLFYRPMLDNKEQSIIIRIDKSTTAYSLVNQLKDEHLIKSRRLLLWLIRVKGWSAQLKAGIYEIKPGESSSSFLQRVVSGDVLKKSFQIIEGTTKNQIDVNLQHAPFLDYSPNDWSFVTKTFTNAEGLLLADTYYYDAGSQGKDLLNRAHQNLMTYLEQSWKTRDVNLPYKSSYELLTTASILEKETALASERRLIAGVIINRLRKNMPLQMDPTIIYALGPRYSGSLSHNDLQVDSPYNSYRQRGLPPTPIAMVGKDAIDAAAHPQITNFLYFVAKGDGSHYFSVNYEQQRQAIDRYLKNRKLTSHE
jgi:UPF0755 protein